MKTLTTLTGGLDSTFLVWRLLSTTADDVTAFCSCPPQGARTEIQDALAVQAGKVQAWLSANVRPFAFEIINVPHPPNNEPIMCGIIRYAAMRCKRDGFDRFLQARTTDNQRTVGVEMLPKYKAWWGRHSTSALEFPLLDAGFGRAHIWTQCPPDLRALTTGCDRLLLVNNELVRCGKCVKCQMDADIQKFLSQGHTPDDIADYHWRARAAWKYVGQHGEGRFMHITPGDTSGALSD